MVAFYERLAKAKCEYPMSGFDRGECLAVARKSPISKVGVGSPVDRRIYIVSWIFGCREAVRCAHQ